MKTFYSLWLAIAASSAMFAQTTITQWNFDAGNITPSTGAGTASFVTTKASGTQYPSGNPSSGKSWSATSFPAQGTASGTAGFKFDVSTAGYTGISVSVDIAGSNTGSMYFQMQYTTDGTTWTDVGSPSVVGLPTAWTTIQNSIPAADNNAGFGFRLVSVFEPSTSTYKAINSRNYAGSGTIRLDNVTVSGTASSLAVSEIKNVKTETLVKNSHVTDNEIQFGLPSEIKIFSVSGKLLKSASVKKDTSLNVADLSKGIYIVTGTLNGEPVSQKIMKD